MTDCKLKKILWVWLAVFFVCCQGDNKALAVTKGINGFPLEISMVNTNSPSEGEYAQMKVSVSLALPPGYSFALSVSTLEDSSLPNPATAGDDFVKVTDMAVAGINSGSPETIFSLPTNKNSPQEAAEQFVVRLKYVFTKSQWNWFLWDYETIEYDRGEMDCIITIKEDSSTHEITLVVGKGGSVFPAGPVVSVNHEDRPCFRIEPKHGISSVNLFVGPMSLSVPPAWFTNVPAGKTAFEAGGDLCLPPVKGPLILEVRFKHKVTVLESGPGAMQPAGDIIVEDGEDLILRKALDPLTCLKEVLVEGTSLPPASDGSYVIADIFEDITAKAIFSDNALMVTIAPGDAALAGAMWRALALDENGIVLGPAHAKDWLDSGVTIPLGCLPAVLVEFKDDVPGWDPPGSHKFDLNDGTAGLRKYEGVYSRIHKVEVISTGAGSMDPEGTLEVPHGESLALEPHPHPFNCLEKVIVDGETKPPGSPFVVPSVTKDITVTAFFSDDGLKVTISPDKARGEGAMWKAEALDSDDNVTGVLHASSWMSSGEVIPLGCISRVRISFLGISGWAAPLPKNLDLSEGLTEYEGVYREIHEITISSTGAGSVAPEGTVHVVDGGDLFLSVDPDEHNCLEKLVVDNDDLAPAPAYLVPNIKKSMAILAVFSDGGLRVTILPQGANLEGAQWRAELLDGGDVAGPVHDLPWLDSGETLPLGCVSGVRIFFKKISGWEEPKPHDLTLTGGVNGITTHEGVYRKIHRVTVSSMGNGDMSPEGTILVVDGNDLKLTSHPDPYNCLEKLVAGGEVLKPEEEFIIDNIHEDLEITGFFSDDRLKVNILPDEAALDGGMWRAVSLGETGDEEGAVHAVSWNRSGDIISLGCFNNIRVFFRPVNGWVSPDPQDITMAAGADGLLTLTGRYRSKTHVLKIQSRGSGGGHVVLSPVGGGVGGEDTYAYFQGEEVTLEAHAENGSSFYGWGGDVSGGTQVLKFNMDSDKSVFAEFQLAGVDEDGDGYTAEAGDCDDHDAGVHPDALEDCLNFKDDNCDGYVNEGCSALYEDLDQDGFSVSGGDCDDSDPDIYPGAFDKPGDGVDQDCYDGDRSGVPDISDVTCVEISDVPLSASMQSVPPIVIFLIDDSASMDSECMTSDYLNDGNFGDAAYLYDMEDNEFRLRNSKVEYEKKLLQGEGRRKWKSQWAGYNRIFYDPDMDYKPWPRWDGTRDVVNADPDKPRSDPLKSGLTMDMDGIYTMVYADAAGADSEEYVMLTHQEEFYGNGLETLPRYSLADAVRLVKKSDPSVVFSFDNGDGDPEFIHDDKWVLSIDGGSFVGSDYLYTQTDGKRATWFVDMPAAPLAAYDVQVLVPDSPSINVVSKAVYRIKHAGGEDTAEWEKTSAGGVSNIGKWVSLGEYQFKGKDPLARRIYIHNSHYYVQKEGEVYLVNMNGPADSGSFECYIFNDSGEGNGIVEAGELTPLDISQAKAAGVWPERDYLEERRNFANWFSFYRRREFTAKAALGSIIEDMSNAEMGIVTLNAPPMDSVIKIEVDGVDETNQLLSKLYSISSWGETPLRQGLLNIGAYLDQEDSGSGGLSADSPWEIIANGGGCQRAFTVMMTDGYYNGAPPDPPVGNADGDGSRRAPGGWGGVIPSDFDKGVLGDNGDFVQVFGDGHSETLADIAMAYYENDLVEDLPDHMIETGFDLARHQHMVTYSVAFGVVGAHDPESYPDCLPVDCFPWYPDCVPDCPAWEKPDSNEKKIDDLFHASVNGRGRFFNASDSRELSLALKGIFKDIERKVSSGSAVSVDSMRINAGSRIFHARYYQKDWAGDLLAMEVDPETGKIIEEKDPFSGFYSYKIFWSASDKLAETGWENRQIITFNPEKVIDKGAIFSLNNMSDQQKLLFDGQQALVDYLRGDSSLEGTGPGKFRLRKNMLGDIVHGGPLHFEINHEEFVAVGGNDGMLHVFDASTGTDSSGSEVFAYVPNLVYGNLKHLSEQDYWSSHMFYVDQTPYVESMGSSGGGEGPTLLIGGLGKGGRGYYCLDISKIGDAGFQAEFSASDIVLWEYPLLSEKDHYSGTSYPDPDMGYSFSKAYLVNSKAGWVVLFGNGYGSESGEAVLYAIVLDDDGKIDRVKKIRTGFGSAEAGKCNGLSSPALVDADLTRDKLVDYAYAGDLMGNLWKFDLRDSNPDMWKVAHNTQENGLGDPRPLFRAMNSSGLPQPITTRPDVMKHNRHPGYLVVFGTGRLLGSNDLATSSGFIQSIYGIWDWDDAWTARGVSPVNKYLGEFTQDRRLSNVKGDPGEVGQVLVVDLGEVSKGDSLVVNGVTFTSGSKTDSTTGVFAGAEGLAKLVNNDLRGIYGVLAQVNDDRVFLVRIGDYEGPLSVSSDGGIKVSSEARSVGLRRQQIIYGSLDLSQFFDLPFAFEIDYMIGLTDLPVDWFDAVTLSGSHAGWYVDLAGDNERIVQEIVIRDGKVYLVVTIPERSPCSSGGDSITMILNGYTGGNVSESVFDMNLDGVIDNKDSVKIFTKEGQKSICISGIRREGLWSSPNIVALEEDRGNLMYFSTSKGSVESLLTTGGEEGIFYWQEHENNQGGP